MFWVLGPPLWRTNVGALSFNSYFHSPAVPKPGVYLFLHQTISATIIASNNVVGDAGSHKKNTGCSQKMRGQIFNEPACWTFNFSAHAGCSLLAASAWDFRVPPHKSLLKVAIYVPWWWSFGPIPHHITLVRPRSRFCILRYHVTTWRCTILKVLYQYIFIQVNVII